MWCESICYGIARSAKRKIFRLTYENEEEGEKNTEMPQKMESSDARGELLPIQCIPYMQRRLQTTRGESHVC